MVQLWKALAYLAANPKILEGFQPGSIKTGKPGDRQNQPDPAKLAVLDKILNQQHKLRLSVYALAEINRFCQHKEFLPSLQKFWRAIQPEGASTDAFLEACGALLLDRDYRQGFANAPDPAAYLNGQGFAVSEPEAKRLQSKFATGSAASSVSEDFFHFFWHGSSCLGRLSYYNKYTHPNY